MITQENQLHKPSLGKNLRKIWSSYPQGKQIHYDRIEDYNRFKP